MFSSVRLSIVPVRIFVEVLCENFSPFHLHDIEILDTVEITPYSMAGTKRHPVDYTHKCIIHVTIPGAFVYIMGMRWCIDVLSPYIKTSRKCRRSFWDWLIFGRFLKHICLHIEGDPCGWVFADRCGPIIPDLWFRTKPSDFILGKGLLQLTYRAQGGKKSLSKLHAWVFG